MWQNADQVVLSETARTCNRGNGCSGEASLSASMPGRRVARYSPWRLNVSVTLRRDLLSSQSLQTQYDQLRPRAPKCTLAVVMRLSSSRSPSTGSDKKAALNI